MCYNAPTSIIYFCIISVIIFYLWRRNKNNDRWFSLLFACVNFVQLGEFIIWRYINNSKINKIGTKIIKLSIYLQPLVILLGGMLIGNINKKYKNIFNILTVIYSVIFGYEIIKSFFINVNVSKKLGNHLDWNKNIFPNNYFLGSLYIISFLFILFQNGNIIQSLILILFIYLSFLIDKLFLKNNTWKSIWCFLGNFTPIIYLLTTIS